jgi:hypothetical protein
MRIDAQLCCLEVILIAAVAAAVCSVVELNTIHSTFSPSHSLYLSLTDNFCKHASTTNVFVCLDLTRTPTNAAAVTYVASKHGKVVKTF